MIYIYICFNIFNYYVCNVCRNIHIHIYIHIHLYVYMAMAQILAANSDHTIRLIVLFSSPTINVLDMNFE